MQKRVLVAVDESFHAKNALRYAADFHLPGSDFQMTLMHVQPILSGYLHDEAKNSPKIKMALEEVRTENSIKSHKILADYREQLIHEGIPAECIETVSQIRELGLSKDIIEYGHRYCFDAIVAGRRGLSRIQKVFMGSTSAKLIEHADHIPLWIVDGQVRPQRLLVAVDLQTSVSPLIHHIARMCSGMDQLHLTFFHVFNNLKIGHFAPHTPGADQIDALIDKHQEQMMEKFWHQTRKELIKCGLSEEQMVTKFVRRNAIAGVKTAKLIMEEIEDNPYDTVVMDAPAPAKPSISAAYPGMSSND